MASFDADTQTSSASGAGPVLSGSSVRADVARVDLRGAGPVLSGSSVRADAPTYPGTASGSSSSGVPQGFEPGGGGGAR